MRPSAQARLAPAVSAVLGSACAVLSYLLQWRRLILQPVLESMQGALEVNCVLSSQAFFTVAEEIP